MNPYIKNFPKDPFIGRWTNLHTGGEECGLCDSRGWSIAVEASEHSRLIGLIPRGQTGADIYASVVLLKPHLRAFLGSDLQAVIEARPDANRIKKAIEEGRVADVRLDFKRGKLQGGAINIHFEKRDHSYPLPGFLLFIIVQGDLKNPFLAEVGKAVGEEANFSLTLKKGRQFKRILSDFSWVIDLIYIKYRERRASDVKELFRWQFLPYLNSLYEFVKDNIQEIGGNESPLRYTAKVLGAPQLEGMYSDIIGRGKKRVFLNNMDAWLITKNRLEALDYGLAVRIQRGK